MSFLSQLLFFQESLSKGELDDDAIEIFGCLLNAQRCAFELFKMVTGIQKRYAQVLSPNHDLIYFFIEIGHVFSFSLPLPAFSDNSSRASQKIVKLWKDKLGSISQACPAFSKSFLI
ncbi:hypothetical protein DSO57_1031553 [Entomophthora muscae]|uniref:Uncharacterized protein n=1 Tax=Entomophthora muscae TaxID=34485 RepID=A0ACC2SPY7_9FUNG|nr:hypothetical protein DSO57_1031553 [Entomophthora muscae]